MQIARIQYKYLHTFTKVQSSSCLFVESIHAELKIRSQKFWCNAQVSYLCNIDSNGVSLQYFVVNFISLLLVVI